MHVTESTVLSSAPPTRICEPRTDQQQVPHHGKRALANDVCVTGGDCRYGSPKGCSNAHHAVHLVLCWLALACQPTGAASQHVVCNPSLVCPVSECQLVRLCHDAVPVAAWEAAVIHSSWSGDSMTALSVCRNCAASAPYTMRWSHVMFTCNARTWRAGAILSTVPASCCEVAMGVEQCHQQYSKVC